MKITQKVRNVFRALLQASGPGNVKRRLWNDEFSRGRWSCLDATPGDCVYAYIEKYANRGSILDLGCGSGNTGNELDETKYRHYMGVDISDVAIGNAKRRSEEAGRIERNHFFQSDILTYVPTQQYDVILFRDSIYYLPGRKIKRTLNRYLTYLKGGGVVIVRIFNASGKCGRIIDVIESSFKVVEKYLSDQTKTVVVVFGPGDS